MIMVGIGCTAEGEVRGYREARKAEGKIQVRFRCERIGELVELGQLFG
jgi:hypothetical protein